MKTRLFHILAPLCMALPALADVTSTDGQWTARAEAGDLIIFDLAGTPAHQRPLADAHGQAAQSAALMAQPEPFGFLVALEGLPELWLVALDADAGPFHQGFVHSYVAGMEESLTQETGRFARQRIELTAPVTALRSDPAKRYTVQGLRADGTCIRIHLVAKREIGPCPNLPNATKD